MPASASLPLLLLDDVTSELDPERRELLCARLVAGGGQALITATEAGHLPAACPRVELAVRDGAVIQGLSRLSAAGAPRTRLTELGGRVGAPAAAAGTSRTRWLPRSSPCGPRSRR